MITIETDSNNVGKEPIKELPTLTLGQTFTNPQLDVTVKSIEYVEDGFKIYFYVYNKSTIPLRAPGTMKLKLDNPLYEKELNSMGYSVNFNTNGYIYQGEKRDGYYQWYFSKDVKVKEIEYYSNYSHALGSPIAIWKAE